MTETIPAKSIAGPSTLKFIANSSMKLYIVTGVLDP